MIPDTSDQELNSLRNQLVVTSTASFSTAQSKSPMPFNAPSRCFNAKNDGMLDDAEQRSSAHLASLIASALGICGTLSHKRIYKPRHRYFPGQMVLGEAMC